MGGRYLVTGVQLGMLVALDKKERLDLVEKIIDEQFVGKGKKTYTEKEMKKMLGKWGIKIGGKINCSGSINVNGRKFTQREDGLFEEVEK